MNKQSDDFGNYAVNAIEFDRVRDKLVPMSSPESQHTAPESIVEFACRQPYEYLEQLRSEQGATCSCCTPVHSSEPLKPPSTSIAKEPHYLAVALAHLTQGDTCMCPSCFLTRSYAAITVK